MDPDVLLSSQHPHRVESGGLAPGETIAQGGSVTILIKAEELDALRVRAQVSGTTGDLDLAPLLGDEATQASTEVPATTALADGVENSVDVDVVGEDLWELTLTNTGAGPDLVIGYVDLYPTFR